MGSRFGHWTNLLQVIYNLLVDMNVVGFFTRQSIEDFRTIIFIRFFAATFLWSKKRQYCEEFASQECARATLAER